MYEGSPRRIALIASSFAPHVGGVEEHVAQVARRLHAGGHVVEVWTVDRGAPPSDPFVGDDGAEIRVRYLPAPLPARSATGMARFAIRVPGAWLAWRAAFRRLRPHVLHVQCFGPNGVYAEALHRRARVPLVVSAHGETFADDNGIYARSAFLRDRLRRALSEAAAVTAPSGFVLDDLRRRFGLAGGEVVPNGVDLAVSASPAAATSPPFLFAVGRLGRVKGFDLLIDAFARAGLSGLRLLVGGEGPERAALAQRAADLGADVEFLGRLSAAEVAQRMRSAVAVIVPSRVEAFGIVALEAWREGAALVMTDRGGASEFVTDGVDGLLVDPTDADVLAGTLTRVATDAELRQRLAGNGLARVAEFTWDRVAQRYATLYARVTAGRGLGGR